LAEYYFGGAILDYEEVTSFAALWFTKAARDGLCELYIWLAQNSGKLWEIWEVCVGKLQKLGLSRRSSKVDFWGHSLLCVCKKVVLSKLILWSWILLLLKNGLWRPGRKTWGWLMQDFKFDSLRAFFTTFSEVLSGLTRFEGPFEIVDLAVDWKAQGILWGQKWAHFFFSVTDFI
jgi:hypothetical protein